MICPLLQIDGGGCMLTGHMIYLLKLKTDDCKTAPWLYLKWDDVQQRYLLFAARTFPPRTTMTFVTGDVIYKMEKAGCR